MRVGKAKSVGRSAFTLVEMLIAMALTLILVYAIAEFYSYIGNAVRDGRGAIEIQSQLRAVSQQLNADLQSLTLRPEPWIDSNASPGYFTVYEGPYNDSYPDGGTSDITIDSDNNNVPDLVDGNVTNLVGDGDDVLAFTIRAGATPFQAQVYTTSGNVIVTSQYAEVIWFTAFSDLDGDSTWDINEPRFLCRRQLVILPGLGTLPMQSNLAAFVQDAEVSFRVNNSGQPVANSLADLTLRHCRFGCQPSGGAPTYPSPLYFNPTNSSSVTTYTLQNNKFGEDRLLSNLLAFDVKVYDPTAPIYRDTDSTTALVPGDWRYAASINSSNLIGQGAWVDLSYNRGLSTSLSSYFSGPPASPFNLAPISPPTTQPYHFHMWDTWSTAYELTNFGYPGFPGTGRSANGLDDDNANGVDDAGERQTQPPYAAPLRGIQVRVRVYEPATRQMRQMTVGADFIAE